MKISIIFLVFFLSCFVLLVYMHERVHVEIFRSDGINSRIEWFSHFPDIVTVGEPCSDTCKFSHNINESVGYHLIPFYLLLGFGLLIIITMIEMNSRNDGNKEIKYKKAKS